MTLIFSLERYDAVMDAFLDGMGRAQETGRDLSRLTSVASFFVSRVDTEIDRRLATIGSPEARALMGKAGVANARLAYQHYEERFSPPARGRCRRSPPATPAVGLHRCEEPTYPDTRYVGELIASTCGQHHAGRPPWRR